jgi:hypothetical protein
VPRVLLDGYNLLLGEGRGAGEAARDRLVRDAARYRSGRAIEVVVVFDSRQGAGSSAAPVAGVRVEYARGDADSAILEMVRKSRSPRDLLVVTSDRRLAEQARDLGARTEDVATFRARADRRAAGKPREKQDRPSPSEVAEWLRVFGEKRGEDDW